MSELTEARAIATALSAKMIDEDHAVELITSLVYAAYDLGYEDSRDYYSSTGEK